MAKILNFDRVDQLAALNAQIAALQAEADELKAKIVKSGFDIIETEQYKCVVSRTAESFSVDYKAVVNAIKPAPEVLNLYRKKRAASVRVSLYDL